MHQSTARAARWVRRGALFLMLVCPGAVAMADELERQWLHGRVDQVRWSTPSAAPSAAPTSEPEAAVALDERVAGLGWDGPPGSTTVELHRRLGEVETLDRLWNGRRSEALLTVRPEADGRFRLRTPDAGPWRVVVRAPGFLAMQVVPPSVPDVVELGTVWMVPSREVDLTPHLRRLFRGGSASGAVEPERIWLASDGAEHAGLRLQRPLHDWRPEPVRQWWQGETLSVVVPRAGSRTVWSLRPPGRSTDRNPMVLLRLQQDQLLVEPAPGLRGRSPSASGTPVVAEVSLARPDAEPGAAPCQGVVLGRPLGPLESRFTLGLRAGDRLRVVCPEGAVTVTVPEPPVASATSSTPNVRVDAVVLAPRLPDIRWRLEGSGQTVERVALVTGVGHLQTQPARKAREAREEGEAAAEAPDELQDLAAGPPLATAGAVTRDPAVGWVEVRAPGIAGGRLPAAEFLATANQDAVPAGPDGASGRRVVDAWLRRPSHIEGWVRGDFGEGVPGVDIVAVDAALVAENSADEVPHLAADPAFAPRAVWAHTDAEGRFRLRDVPPDRPLLLAALSSEYPPLVVEERSPEAGSRRQDVRIDLARPLDLVGWVLDDAGAPVSQAEVTLRRFAPVGRLQVVSGVLRGPHHPNHERRFATTDDQGRFVFLDAELTRLSLDVAAPGLASTFVSGFEPQRSDATVRNERLEIELGTFEMVPERRVALRVVDREGVPVPGALVSWSSSLLPASTPLRFASRSPYRENPLQPVWHNVDADPHGEAVLGGIEEEATVTVLVEAAGFVPHRVDELVVDWTTPQTEPVEVVLMPEARISGRVERADGSPLEDAYVALHVTDIAVDIGSPSLRTGMDGQFSFDRLPPGELRVTVSAVDEAAIDPLDLQVEVGQQIEGLVLRAPPSAPVEGRVMEDGAPLEGVSVACCGDLARTDTSGAFRIERARLGSHELEVRLRGRDDHLVRIEVGSSRNWFDIDVARDPDLDRPRRTLRGFLRGSAAVEEQIRDGSLAPGMELRSSTTGLAEPVLLTGLGLGFAAFDVPADRYVLTVAAPGARLAAVPVDLREGDVTDLVVELEAAANATLRVTAMNADARSSEGWFRFGLPLLLRGESGMVMNRTARWFTEDDYVVERLSPGRWILEAETADGLRRARAEVELPLDGGEAHAVLSFEDSERVRFTGTLRVDGLPTSGWIMVRSGAGSPVAGGTRFGGVLESDAPGPRSDVGRPTTSARSNSLGQFEFVAAPGPARLLVSTGSRALGWVDVDLVPGVPLTLDLMRRVLVGRVEDEAGRPVAATTVIARDAGGGTFRGRATSEPSGAFVVEMLVEHGGSGPLEVAVEGAEHGLGPAEWTPVPGDSVVVRVPTSNAAVGPP